MGDEITLGEIARRLDRIEAKVDTHPTSSLVAAEFKAHEQRIIDLESEQIWARRSIYGAFITALGAIVLDLLTRG